MSVTAAPIQPTPKGTLTTLFAGVALAVVLASGLAWMGTAKAVSGGCGVDAFLPVKGAVTAPVTSETGLGFQTVKAGAGPSPTDADVALVNYRGTLADGKEFDANQRVPFPVQQVIPGFTEALKKMARGGSYRICIPPALGYGAVANERIPANSILRFEVELIDFRSLAEYEAAQQQMQQQQQGGTGRPQGAPQGR